MPFVRRTPNGAQQLRMRKNAAGVPRQLGKHAIFLGRQMNVSAIPTDAAGKQINLKTVDTNSFIAVSGYSRNRRGPSFRLRVS